MKTHQCAVSVQDTVQDTCHYTAMCCQCSQDTVPCTANPLPYGVQQESFVSVGAKVNVEVTVVGCRGVECSCRVQTSVQRIIAWLVVQVTVECRAVACRVQSCSVQAVVCMLQGVEVTVEVTVGCRGVVCSLACRAVECRPACRGSMPAGRRGRYKVEGGESVGWLEHGLGVGGSRAGYFPHGITPFKFLYVHLINNLVNQQ